MRTRARSARVAAGLGAVLVVLLALAAGGGAGAADDDTGGAAGWQGLLGSRPLPQLGGRWIVVLKAPSLAERVRRAGGTATEREMRAWTTAAGEAQQRAIFRLAFHGAPIQPDSDSPAPAWSMRSACAEKSTSSASSRRRSGCASRAPSMSAARPLFLPFFRKDL